MQQLFTETAIIILAAAFLAYISKLIKQPLIPAYILAGVILGPILHVINDPVGIGYLSQFGIAFLLFTIGLELDLKNLKGVGMVSTIGGITQILLIFLATFAISIALGFKSIAAAYLGIVLAFSSTAVVVKILSEKNQLNTLHGKITIGILLVQDVAAIFTLIVLTSQGFAFIEIFQTVLKGFGALMIAIILGEFVFPKLFKPAAQNQELLFILTISVCLLFGAMFDMLGLSMAIGAFLAGLTLSSLPYSFEMNQKIKPLRTFFLVIFFVSIGTLIEIAGVKWLPLVLFAIIILVLKPWIIIVTCAAFGYCKKTCFLTGAALGQVSEFGFIIVAQGLLLGHITSEIYSYIIILAVVTITITSYALKYDKKVYDFIETRLGLLHPLENISKNKIIIGTVPEQPNHDVVICGYDRMGRMLGRDLQAAKKKILVVDYNPEIVSKLASEGVPCVYGDISDPDTVHSLHLNMAKIVISTVPDFENNKHILREAKKHNEQCIVILTAEQADEALELYAYGADYIIVPHFLGAAHASLVLKDATKDIKSVLKKKIVHISELEDRLRLGLEHHTIHRHTTR